MTYSLTVAGGDLVQVGSQMQIVSGQDKLRQDLQLWLAERYGIDRFHPKMGSMLQSYIGSVIGQNTNAMVQQEVLRVLQNYQRVQSMGFKAAPSMYSFAELLYSINGVAVSATYDTVSVSISITNGAAQTSTITASQGVS